MLTFYIDKENRLIIEKFAGITRIGSIEKLMVHIWDHPHYNKEFDRIVDFQDSNLVFSREEFRHFVEVIKESANSMRGKAAVLVQAPVSAAIVTMYEDRMNHLHKVGIFCSESEVVNFLNCDVSIFDKLQSSDVVKVPIEE